MSTEVRQYYSYPKFSGSSDWENQSKYPYKISDCPEWKPGYIQTALEILEFKNNNSSNWVYLEDKILELFGKELYSEVFKFALALQAYDDCNYDNKMHTEDIWKQCFLLGPDFALYLKRYKTKSFIKSISALLLTEPDWYEEQKFSKVKDIGEIFNYSYLINWREPSSKDLEEFSFSKPSLLDEDYLEGFRESIRYELDRIHMNNVKIIPKNEILLSTSSSSTYNSIPLAYDKMCKPYRNYMASQVGNTRHYSLQKKPTEVRDILLLNQEDSNLVKWIDKQTLEIVQLHPWSGHTKHPHIFAKRYEDMTKSNTYYCRDIEKEGLSKPKELLEIMLEELYDYTKLDVYKNAYALSNISVDNNLLLRGHGLGMANSLTTLMQIGIHRLCIIVFNRRYEREINPPGIFLNDDATVGLDGLTEADDFKEIDFEVCENIGVNCKDTKSFMSNFGFTFCEKYYSRSLHNFNDKRSYYMRNAIMPMLACNVTHAKEKCVGIDSPADFIDYYKPYITQKWGYELVEYEYELPTTFGGWNSYQLGPISMDLFVVDALGLNNNLLARLWTAGRCIFRPPQKFLKTLSKRFRKKIGGSFEFYHIFNTLTSFSEQELEAESVNNELSLIENSIHWKNYPEVYNASWEILYNKRQAAFKKCNLNFFNKEDLYYHIINKSPNNEYFPPKCLNYGMENYEEGDEVYEDIYQPALPLINKVICYKQAQYGFIQPNYLGLKQVARPLINQLEFREEEIKWKTDTYTFDLYMDKEVTVNRTSESFERAFINTAIALQISESFYGNRMCPKLRYTHPYYLEKESVYYGIPDIFQSDQILRLENPLKREMLRYVITDVNQIDEYIIDELNQIDLFEEVIKEPEYSEKEYPDSVSEDSGEEASEPIVTMANEVMATIKLNFAWSRSDWSAQRGPKGPREGFQFKTMGYEEHFILIPKVRELVIELASAESYNNWIRSNPHGRTEWEIPDIEDEDLGSDLGALWQ